MNPKIENNKLSINERALLIRDKLSSLNLPESTDCQLGKVLAESIEGISRVMPDTGPSSGANITAHEAANFFQRVGDSVQPASSEPEVRRLLSIIQHITALERVLFPKGRAGHNRSGGSPSATPEANGANASDNAGPHGGIGGVADERGRSESPASTDQRIKNAIKEMGVKHGELFIPKHSPIGAVVVYRNRDYRNEECDPFVVRINVAQGTAEKIFRERDFGYQLSDPFMILSDGTVVMPVNKHDERFLLDVSNEEILFENAQSLWSVEGTVFAVHEGRMIKHPSGDVVQVNGENIVSARECFSGNGGSYVVVKTASGSRGLLNLQTSEISLLSQEHSSEQNSGTIYVFSGDRVLFKSRYWHNPDKAVVDLQTGQCITLSSFGITRLLDQHGPLFANDLLISSYASSKDRGVNGAGYKVIEHYLGVFMYNTGERVELPYRVKPPKDEQAIYGAYNGPYFSLRCGFRYQGRLYFVVQEDKDYPGQTGSVRPRRNCFLYDVTARAQADLSKEFPKYESWHFPDEFEKGKLGDLNLRPILKRLASQGNQGDT